MHASKLALFASSLCFLSPRMDFIHPENEHVIVWIRSNIAFPFERREKAHFFGNTTVNQCLCANLKNMFFAKFCFKFLAFFSFLLLKTLKMTISTSVWNAQPSVKLVEIYNIHPSAMQRSLIFFLFLTTPEDASE